MTNEMLSQARDITFSYPKTEDNRDCAPSNIIKGLDSNIIGLELEDPYLNYSNEMSSLSEKEFIVEQFAPALIEGQTTQGGTAILRDQAHCPFKGFVNNRLNVKALAVQEVGLSASMRGDLLHSCLDKFWRQVKNHKNLCELIELGTLETKVSSVIHASIKYFRDRYPDVFTDAIVQLEHDRLVPNITTWMTTFEEPRSPFEKVITEQTRIFSVNGLELTVKVDHTDITISEGGVPKVNIADNKSGNVTPNDWFDKARLMEPQVPLYAIIEQDFGQSIGSVVFKSFKRGKMGNKGIAESQGQAIKVKPIGETGINTAVDTWRVQIDELAGEYRSGEASVKPHNVVKSCTYCQNKSICRIAEKDENAELKTDDENNTANKESRVIDTETASTSAEYS
jgi:ATP-dependent helicase/DNAse subunit B